MEAHSTMNITTTTGPGTAGMRADTAMNAMKETAWGTSQNMTITKPDPTATARTIMDGRDKATETPAEHNDVVSGLAILTIIPGKAMTGEAIQDMVTRTETGINHP